MNDKENELYEKYDPDEPYDPTKAYNTYLKNFKEALKKNGETTKEINEKVIDFKLLFLGFLLHVVSVNLTKGNVKIIDSEGNEIKKILTLYEKSSDSTKKSSKFSPIKYSNTLQLIFKELSDDGSIPFTLADFCYSPKEIEELLQWYHTQEKSLYTLAKFHIRYESIHPFQDGNGRTGRLILFRECLKNKIIPFIIEDRNRNLYIDALKAAREDKLFSLAAFKASI